MSQILLVQDPTTTTDDISENILWLGLGNKYIENQWTLEKNWGKLEMVTKDNFDQSFINEYSFICKNMK
jgi:hypothetical protein